MKIDSLCVCNLDKVLEIEKKCFSDPWTKTMFLSEISSKFAWFFTACEEDEIVGFAGIVVCLTSGNYKYCSFTSIKCGHRQMLLDKLIAFAKEKGASFVLEARKSNQAARRLYLNNGFKEIECERAIMKRQRRRRNYEV